ncbi:MAG: basic secretory protein-like protein [Fimbriimonas sp.]
MNVLPLLALALPFMGQSTEDPLARHVYPLSPALTTPPVVIDVTDAPHTKAWAEKAKALVEAWYPTVTSLLATESYKPPKTIKLTFKKEISAPAWAANGEITINGKWITEHPDDLGMVIHELTHIVQSYSWNRTPGWLTEGIADYVRWWRYEPEAPRPKVDPVKASYKDAYRTTAAFLAWSSRKYDMRLVPALDRAIRERRDPLAEFSRLTGKDVDALWAEYVATLK